MDVPQPSLLDQLWWWRGGCWHAQTPTRFRRSLVACFNSIRDPVVFCLLCPCHPFTHCCILKQFMAQWSSTTPTIATRDAAGTPKCFKWLTLPLWLLRQWRLWLLLRMLLRCPCSSSHRVSLLGMLLHQTHAFTAIVVNVHSGNSCSTRAMIGTSTRKDSLLQIIVERPCWRRCTARYTHPRCAVCCSCCGGRRATV